MSFQLSRPARRDLDALLDYGGEQWGDAAGLAYANDLLATCGRLGARPMIGRNRGDLLQGMRSWVFRSHMIFYRMLPAGGIEVIRILHQRQDIAEAFDDTT